MNEITRHALVAVPLAALLLAAPAPLNGGKSMSYDAAYAAAGGNGKGNGNGGANGQGGPNGGASANNQGGGSNQGNGSSQGNKLGNSDIKVASGQLKAKNDLGRLNAFMHASSTALLNAAPNSAIGIISVQYRDAISTYLDGIALGVVPAPTIDDAAAILAKAANKTLTPDVVAAINARLAAENPDNLNLATFTSADPIVQATNALLADNLSNAANLVQQTEANQGLGPIY